MRNWTILLVFLTILQAAARAQPAGGSLCATERIHCFLPGEDRLNASGAPGIPITRPGTVTMSVRASHGGLFAHQWIELDTDRGKVTIGYGPASMPFIDAGQISVWNQDGTVQRSGLHLLPTDFNYAKPPGAGQVVGTSIQLTPAQSNTILQKESHRKLIFPYIPIFHDCHTFVCTVKATADGKSSLPCYLLFKGYW
jgi:hypothetical protein